MLDITEDIASLSNFQRNPRDFLRRLQKTRRPLILTVHGKPELIVQDAVSYQELLERLARIDSPRAGALGPVSQQAAQKSSKKTETHSNSAGNPRFSASQRFFRAEGPTTVIVRLLHENRDGMTMFEMRERNGIAISARTLRKIVKRLVAAGCARRKGRKVTLTERGIGLWEASPLFLLFQRDGQFS